MDLIAGFASCVDFVAEFVIPNDFVVDNSTPSHAHGSEEIIGGSEPQLSHIWNLWVCDDMMMEMTRSTMTATEMASYNDGNREKEDDKMVTGR